MDTVVGTKLFGVIDDPFVIVDEWRVAASPVVPDLLIP
jgi:hypothetical protein